MLNVLIVDDESPARDRLKKLLKDLRSDYKISIKGECENGYEALSSLEAGGVDLLFLDIRMPELNGFDVLERIHPDKRPLVVFTTAYDEYAIQAFDENAIDYLLKPISIERLEKAVKRAIRFSEMPEERLSFDDRIGKLMDFVDAQSEESISTGTPSAQGVDQISIPFRDRILIVPVDRLVCAEINDGITRLNILQEPDSDGRKALRQHIVSYTLDQLTDTLSSVHFLRVHRSALVQLSHIKEMIPWFSGRYKLILTGGHEVMASRERSKLLKDRLVF